PPRPGHDEAAESSTPPGAAQPAAGTREPTADTPTQMPSPATPTPSALAAPARQDDGQALGRAAAPAPVVHAPQSASQAQVSGAAASLSVTDAAVVEPLRGVLAPRISQAMTTVGQAPSSEPFLHRPEAGAHPRLPLHPRSGSPAN